MTLEKVSRLKSEVNNSTQFDFHYKNFNYNYKYDKKALVVQWQYPHQLGTTPHGPHGSSSSQLGATLKGAKGRGGPT